MHFFPGNARLTEICIRAASYFITCMEWVLSKAVDCGHYGVHIANTIVTDLGFASDAVILHEFLEILVLSLGARHKEVKPL